MIVYKDDTVVASEVGMADNYFKRLKGLMFKPGMERHRGLLIEPCNQVHTFNMKFDIDVIFLDRSFKVIYIEHSMRKGRTTKIIKNAHYVLELCAGVAKEKNINIDDVLSIKKKRQVQEVIVS